MIVKYSQLRKSISTSQTISLYRGLSKEMEDKYARSEAPTGYSFWTDSFELAQEYAGADGFIYKIDLPLSELGDSYIDEDGERPLFYKTEKPCSINDVRGNEYLIYHDHDLFPEFKISLVAEK